MDSGKRRDASAVRSWPSVWRLCCKSLCDRKHVIRDHLVGMKVLIEVLAAFCGDTISLILMCKIEVDFLLQVAQIVSDLNVVFPRHQRHMELRRKSQRDHAGP